MKVTSHFIGVKVNSRVLAGLLGAGHIVNING